MRLAALAAVAGPDDRGDVLRCVEVRCRHRSGDRAEEARRLLVVLAKGCEEELVKAGYGANYERLAKLKAQYDPRNLFRMTLNITPAA